MFSVVNAILLRPLPFRAADRLLWITEFYPRSKTSFVLGPDFVGWRQQNQTLEEIAAYGTGISPFTNLVTPGLENPSEFKVPELRPTSFHSWVFIHSSAVNSFQKRTAPGRNLWLCWAMISGSDVLVPIPPLSAKQSYWMGVLLLWLESCLRTSGFLRNFRENCSRLPVCPLRVSGMSARSSC